MTAAGTPCALPITSSPLWPIAVEMGKWGICAVGDRGRAARGCGEGAEAGAEHEADGRPQGDFDWMSFTASDSCGMSSIGHGIGAAGFADAGKVAERLAADHPLRGETGRLRRLEHCVEDEGRRPLSRRWQQRRCRHRPGPG